MNDVFVCRLTIEGTRILAQEGDTSWLNFSYTPYSRLVRRAVHFMEDGELWLRALAEGYPADGPLRVEISQESQQAVGQFVRSTPDAHIDPLLNQWRRQQRRRRLTKLLLRLPVLILLLIAAVLFLRSKEIGPWASRGWTVDASITREAEVRKASRQVYLLSNSSCQRKEASAWLARPGLLVTSAGAGAGGKSVLVRNHGRWLRGKTIAVDKSLDLALVRVLRIREGSLKLASVPRAKTSAAVVSYRGQDQRTVVAGLERPTSPPIVNEWGRSSGQELMELEKVLRPGDLGAPVLLKNGRLVGVVFALEEKRSWVLPTRQVQAFIRRAIAAPRYRSGSCSRL